MRDLQTITLRELHPPSIAGDPDILAMAEAVDAELCKATGRVPALAIILRLRLAWEAIRANPSISDAAIGAIIDPAIVDQKAWDWHVDFYEPDAPLVTRVRLVCKSLDWHTRKGTPSVVEEVVTAALSDAEVIEWFDYGGEPFFFRVSTEMPLSDEADIRRLVEAITSVKNTRSWLEFIEAVSVAWLRQYHAVGVALLDTVDVSLRPPDIPPFIDGKIESIEVYVTAHALIRGRIVTQAEPYDAALLRMGAYERVDGTIVTKGEQI